MKYNLVFYMLLMLMLFAMLTCGCVESTLPLNTPYYSSTIYPNDVIANSLSFYCHESGSLIKEGRIVNEVVNDITTVSQKGIHSFKVGLRSGENAFIVDLGTSDEMAAKYNCEQYNALIGIQFRDNSFKITNKENQLVDIDTSNKVLNTIQIQLGHVYVVSIKDDASSELSLVAKFIVTKVDVSADGLLEAVVLRYQTLLASSSRRNCPNSDDSSNEELETSLGISILALCVSLIIGMVSIGFCFCSLYSSKKQQVYTSVQ